MLMERTLSNLKVAILPKLIYKFSGTLIKIPNRFLFVTLWQTLLKFI